MQARIIGRRSSRRHATKPKPMSIKVKFFARMREDAGVGEREIPYRPGLSPGEVWRLAGAQGDLPQGALVAVNMEYVRSAVTLRDGDEVAFFPAVTGG
jgi:molybdopterin synthase sulfur carrier subunit